MLCIHDSNTNSWIASEFSYLKALGIYYSWIGYADYPIYDRNYNWVPGCSSFYTNWLNKSIQHDYYGGAAFMSTKGTWDVASYIYGGYRQVTCSCQYFLGGSDPVATPTTAGCPSDWIEYNNKCYKFNVEGGKRLSTSYYQYTWSGCESQCSSLSSSMLCIPDSTTNGFVNSHLNQFYVYESWIGYSGYPINISIIGHLDVPLHIQICITTHMITALLSMHICQGIPETGSLTMITITVVAAVNLLQQLKTIHQHMVMMPHHIMMMMHHLNLQSTQSLAP